MGEATCDCYMCSQRRISYPSEAEWAALAAGGYGQKTPAPEIKTMESIKPTAASGLPLPTFTIHAVENGYIIMKDSKVYVCHTEGLATLLESLAK